MVGSTRSWRRRPSASPRTTRPPRLSRVLILAHLGIVGPVGCTRVGRVLAAFRPFTGPGLRVFHAHAFGILRLRRLALLALLVLAAVLALFLLVVVLLARAFVPHVKRIEQIVHNVAESTLVLDQPLQAIELAPGALLDER